MVAPILVAIQTTLGIQYTLRLNLFGHTQDPTMKPKFNFHLVTMLRWTKSRHLSQSLNSVNKKLRITVHQISLLVLVGG